MTSRKKRRLEGKVEVTRRAAAACGYSQQPEREREREREGGRERERETSTDDIILQENKRRRKSLFLDEKKLIGWFRERAAGAAGCVCVCVCVYVCVCVCVCMCVCVCVYRRGTRRKELRHRSAGYGSRLASEEGGDEEGGDGPGRWRPGGKRRRISVKRERGGGRLPRVLRAAPHVA